jgi:tripartite-type tricarboxylate transporter receptor subunit TctC
VEQLANDAANILQQASNREQIRAQGMNEVFLRPGAFANHLRAETTQWARIIKAKKIEAQ